MRLTGWNIYDGGVGRADPIAEVLLAQRSQVVCLLEADDPAMLERIARRLNMTAYTGIGRNRRTAAVLTALEVLEAVNHAALLDDGPRSLLEVRLRDTCGREWVVVATHLDPHPTPDAEQTRLRQWDALRAAIGPVVDSGVAVLLVGDFNADAPSQRIDFTRADRRTVESFEQRGDVPRQLISKVLADGFIDTLAQVRPDYASTAPTFTTHRRARRVDYIFTTNLPAERIVDAWVEHDDLARYASDHFPVGVEIR